MEIMHNTKEKTWVTWKIVFGILDRNFTLCMFFRLCYWSLNCQWSIFFSVFVLFFVQVSFVKYAESNWEKPNLPLRQTGIRLPITSIDGEINGSLKIYHYFLLIFSIDTWRKLHVQSIAGSYSQFKLHFKVLSFFFGLSPKHQKEIITKSDTCKYIPPEVYGASPLCLFLLTFWWLYIRNWALWWHSDLRSI